KINFLSVCNFSKMPLSRPPNYQFLQERRREAVRGQLLDYKKDIGNCDVKTSLFESSKHHYVRKAVERRVGADRQQHQAQINQRRCRLQTLETEKEQLLQEMKDKMKEMKTERLSGMQERLQFLQERSERERLQQVTEKLEQLFREQDHETRSALSRRHEQQVCQERAVQMRTQQEEERRQREEDRWIEELLEDDQHTRDKLDHLSVQLRHQRVAEQQQELRRQMEEKEKLRQEEKELKEEEARLLRQQNQDLLLEDQRHQQLKLQEQQNHSWQLERDIRSKMRRRVREQQEELQLDMSILQDQTQQTVDLRQEAAERKVTTPETHLDQNRSKPILFTHRIRTVLTVRSMNNNLEKKAELQKEKEALFQAIEEEKLKQEEEKRSRRQATLAYRADLEAQVKEKQHLHGEQRAQTLREDQQGLIQEQLIKCRRDQILARPESNTLSHPFRRTLRSANIMNP
uniref:Cilia- and flagella-associated protein 53 n=1 Tax=Nothobranchius furzeri TaxID=105023 RepID=A0A8C6K5R0_NOTFU